MKLIKNVQFSTPMISGTTMTVLIPTMSFVSPTWCCRSQVNTSILYILGTHTTSTRYLYYIY